MKPLTHTTELPPSTQLPKAVFRVARQIILLLVLVLGSRLAFAQGNVLLTTFTNPTPAFFNVFGRSVAGVGMDQVIIGSGANAAYLFSFDGTLQKTFTVADPLAAYFGGVVVAVGRDRVLISDDSYGSGMGEQIGRAYLFNTNGTLLTTFTNPNPAHVRVFGVSTAVLGSDRLIIAGLQDPNNSAPYLGAVYVYGTNGTLLNAITNPTPAVFNDFGQSVAAVGNDRVLIGAPLGDPGLAYLYRTNGTLLTTFTNPLPETAASFGTPVVAVGSDRVVIGGSDGNGGAVHLFSTDGTLLTTFTNPIPTVGDQFGNSLTVVGNNRILIGANRDDTGAHDTGAAYLFSTNGTLLNTFTNPSPENFDLFGGAVAAVGKDQVLIGASFDNTGAPVAGAAYLFALPYPPLSIARNTGTVSVSWATAETGLILQQADSLGSSVVWSDTTNSVSVIGLTNVVQQATGSAHRFYRLRRP